MYTLYISVHRKKNVYRKTYVPNMSWSFRVDVEIFQGSWWMTPTQTRPHIFGGGKSLKITLHLLLVWNIKKLVIFSWPLLYGLSFLFTGQLHEEFFHLGWNQDCVLWIPGLKIPMGWVFSRKLRQSWITCSVKMAPIRSCIPGSTSNPKKPWYLKLIMTYPP